MKFLAALPLKSKYFRYVEAEIQRIFNEIIYKPLYKAIKDAELRNDLNDDPLYEAIAEGRVWYEDGRFWGTFNAKTSKRLKDMGATYNPKSGTWSYSGVLPVEVSLATAAAASRYRALRQAVLTTLDDMKIGSIDRISKIPNMYHQTITWMDDDFRKALKAVTIVPKLTDEQKNIIAADWGFNLDLYVRNWAAENILKLREMVQTEAFAGKRAESMIEAIEQNYGVSTRKAKFLARQETSLLMSKFHETRFHQLNLPYYKWSTAEDERVRHDHELLNDRVFRWDDPPIVDRASGRKGNPGEDFNCRCVAIPLVGTSHEH